LPSAELDELRFAGNDSFHLMPARQALKRTYFQTLERMRRPSNQTRIVVAVAAANWRNKLLILHKEGMLVHNPRPQPPARVPRVRPAPCRPVPSLDRRLSLRRKMARRGRHTTGVARVFGYYWGAWQVSRGLPVAGDHSADRQNGRPGKQPIEARKNNRASASGHFDRCQSKQTPSRRAFALIIPSIVAGV
jgi:hypothetical protein